MSALVGTDRPAAGGARAGGGRRRTSGRRLRAGARLPGRAAGRLARFPFLLVLIGIFGLGMVGLLMVNTTLQNQAFEARSLNRQATELAYAQADLENRLDKVPRPPSWPGGPRPSACGPTRTPRSWWCRRAR